MVGQTSTASSSAAPIPPESSLDPFTSVSPESQQPAGGSEPPTNAPSEEPSSNPNNNGGLDRVENYLASPAGRRLAVILKLVFIAAITGVLILQQIQFSGTWDRSCDYNIKVWSTVWIARSLLQHIIVLVISCLIMMNKYRPLTIALRRLQTVIFLFKFAWFLYGIKPVLVDERCNSTTGTWGLVLWGLECALTIAPCVCLCLCIPFIICCFWREIPVSPDQPQPTPENIRKKLKLVKYAEIADELEARADEPAQAQPQAEAPGQADEGGILSDMASSLTGVPLPDIGQLRRIQSGILGRQQSGPQPPQRLPSGTQPSASVVGNQLQHQASAAGVMCPICFCNFEQKDEVVVLPCDRRHVFHKDCLFAWLDQSQACPVCRSNIVDSVKRQEEGNQEGNRGTSESTDATNGNPKHDDSSV